MVASLFSFLRPRVSQLKESSAKQQAAQTISAIMGGISDTLDKVAPIASASPLVVKESQAQSTPSRPACEYQGTSLATIESKIEPSGKMSGPAASRRPSVSVRPALLLSMPPGVRVKLLADWVIRGVALFEGCHHEDKPCDVVMK